MQPSQAIGTQAGQVNQNQSGRFAVYGGDGVYLSAIIKSNNARGGDPHALRRWGREPLPMARADAVEALHAARRAGLSAWIVPALGVQS